MRRGVWQPVWMVSGSPLFVLVHSPLLGPSTWEWVARELEQRGRLTVVPSLLATAVAPAPGWREACKTIAACSRGAAGVVLVGHSAAGTLLPAIAESIPVDATGMVFVDAFLPPASGTAPPVPATYIDELKTLAIDGVLPPWSSWFGDEVMRPPSYGLRAAGTSFGLITRATFLGTVNRPRPVRGSSERILRSIRTPTLPAEQSASPA
jgi:pimeloyl-ACP methyl ester carboxylesterase